MTSALRLIAAPSATRWAADGQDIRPLDECEPDGALGAPRPRLVGVRTAPVLRVATDWDSGRRGAAPDAAALAGFVRSLLEVIDRRRPISQLREVLTPLTHAQVQCLMRRTDVRGGRVQRVHTGRPSASAVELAVTVARRDRCTALAARLDIRGELWRCTSIDVLG